MIYHLLSVSDLLCTLYSTHLNRRYGRLAISERWKYHVPMSFVSVPGLLLCTGIQMIQRERGPDHLTPNHFKIAALRTTEKDYIPSIPATTREPLLCLSHSPRHYCSSSPATLLRMSGSRTLKKPSGTHTHCHLGA